MMVPLASEAEWTPTLAAAAPWHPPLRETLVIAPHPDDESLAAGGLIAALASRGVPVRVLAATDGENAYDDGVNLREVRRREQEAALARLGVSAGNIVRLGLPDSGLAGCEGELERAVRSLATRGSHILAPWPHDFHPDHEACGRAAQRVARETGASLSFYFFWTYHRGRPDLLEGRPLLSFALTAEQQRAKLDAVRCHRSQLEHSSGSPILPPNLLWPAAYPCEVFLSA